MTVLECEQTEDGNGSCDFFLTTDRGYYMVNAFIEYTPCKGWELDCDYYYYHDLDQKTEIHTLEKIEEIKEALLFWAENNLCDVEYQKEEQTKDDFFN